MRKRKFISIAFLLVVLIQGSCKKLVEVDAPIDTINTKLVFSNDANATSAVLGIYINMMAPVNGINFIPLGVTTYNGLTADELKIFKPSVLNIYSNFYANTLSVNSIDNASIWAELYRYVYSANVAIENLEGNNELSASVNMQLMGEVKFIRAFCYFYLTNLYGDVPLLTQTNYSVNRLASRTAQSGVYDQIISDLKDAQRFLKPDYSVSINQERIRPNKWAATALLSRVYLYMGRWKDAEVQSSAIISNEILFSLPVIGSDSLNGLNTVFVKNSTETIWALKPVVQGMNTFDASTFLLPPDDIPDPDRLIMSDGLIGAFESGDLRRKAWVKAAKTEELPPKTNYYVYKYKIRSTLQDPAMEYTIVFRLAEQYLIRAEARAMQNYFDAGVMDLNRIRARAGLGNTNATDQNSLIKAILNERQVELFCEFGHRWFDLKRTKNIDMVMKMVSPLKGTVWNTNFQLFPIPQSERSKNVNLTQNTGYD